MTRNYTILSIILVLSLACTNHQGVDALAETVLESDDGTDGLFKSGLQRYRLQQHRGGVEHQEHKKPPSAALEDHDTAPRRQLLKGQLPDDIGEVADNRSLKQKQQRQKKRNGNAPESINETASRDDLTVLSARKKQSSIAAKTKQTLMAARAKQSSNANDMRQRKKTAMRRRRKKARGGRNGERNKVKLRYGNDSGGAATTTNTNSNNNANRNPSGKPGWGSSAQQNKNWWSSAPKLCPCPAPTWQGSWPTWQGSWPTWQGSWNGHNRGKMSPYTAEVSGTGKADKESEMTTFAGGWHGPPGQVPPWQSSWQWQTPAWHGPSRQNWQGGGWNGGKNGWPKKNSAKAIKYKDWAASMPATAGFIHWGWSNSGWSNSGWKGWKGGKSSKNNERKWNERKWQGVWWEPKCPCPEPATESPTIMPTLMPTKNPIQMIRTMSPTTDYPTPGPMIGCPWLYWGGEEGRGSVVGLDQTVPDFIEDDVVDLSAGSRHSFIIYPNGAAYTSGFIESFFSYQGHLGIDRASLEEGPNDWKRVETVVNRNGESVPAPKFMKVYAGAGAPGDSRKMHSVLIDTGGNVYTTGDNDMGQLCLGDLESRDLFHQVILPRPAEAVAVGLDFTLILLENGEVYGCGSNENGELGIGPDVQFSTTPDNRNGLSGIVEISSGLSFGLFLEGSGTVYGSGSNLFSQLCESTDGDPVLSPKELVVTNVASISANRESSYFLYNNGSVESCGRNDEGQLGDGTYVDSDSPVKVNIPKDIKITKLGSGPSSQSVFFIATPDIVYTAGQNYRHQLGIGEIGSREFPILVEFDDVPSLHEIQKISSSGTHTVSITCLIETEKPTESPTEEPTSYPTFSPTLSPVSPPTESPTFSPSLSPTYPPTNIPDIWWFWGAEEGRGCEINTNRKVPDELPGPIAHVSAGSRHSFIIGDEGTGVGRAVAFGFVESELGYRGHLGAGPVGDCRDGDGELCIGDNQSLYVEKVVDASGSLVDAPMFRRVYAGVGIAADSGEMHSLLISEDGKVYTAGSNDFGQLCLGGTGDGDIESVDYFHEVTGIPGKAVSAAVAMRFTLILLEDGRVFGCGSNEVGQIGQGENLNLSNKPVQIEGLEDIIDLAAGLKFSVFTDGSNAYGTGGNIYLQQCKFSDGEPYFEAHQLPVGSGTITQVHASRESAYFLYDDGQVRSCGRNDEGQLGNGNFINSSPDDPVVTVNLDEKVVSLGSGPSAQTVFFIGEENVWASGLNDRYQLGINEIESRATPEQVKFKCEVDIDFVSASGTHSVADGKYISCLPNDEEREDICEVPDAVPLPVPVPDPEPTPDEEETVEPIPAEPEPSSPPPTVGAAGQETAPPTMGAAGAPIASSPSYQPTTPFPTYTPTPDDEGISVTNVEQPSGDQDTSGGNTKPD